MSAPAAIRTSHVQGTPDWIDARRDVVGSSDIPIVTGNSPYERSYLALWAYKTRLDEPPPVDPETQELWDLGHLMEPVIARRYEILERRAGRPGKVKRVNQMLVHPSIPWAAASLDRVSAVKGDRKIIELKWAPHRRFDDGPEPVPTHVQDQVQWQLMVSRYDVAEVAVLHGSHVEIYEVGPDDGYQADLLYLARHFRGYVERGERPPIDGSDATKGVLNRLYPNHDLPLLPPTAEIAALAGDYRVARTTRDEAKDEVGRIRNVLLGVLGDAGGVDGDGYRIRVRQNAASRKTDWKLAAAAYRALIEDAVDRQSVADAIQAVFGERVAVPKALDSLVELHTTEEEGAHVLTVKYQDEETGKWS